MLDIFADVGGEDLGEVLGILFVGGRVRKSTTTSSLDIVNFLVQYFVNLI